TREWAAHRGKSPQSPVFTRDKSSALALVAAHTLLERIKRGQIFAQLALHPLRSTLREVRILLDKFQKGAAGNKQQFAIGDGGKGHRTRLFENERGGGNDAAGLGQRIGFSGLGTF